MKPETKPRNPRNPAGRVDRVIEGVIDLSLKRLVDDRSLTAHLKRAGVDVPAIVRNAVSNQLKREKPFWDKAARALRDFAG